MKNLTRILFTLSAFIFIGLISFIFYNSEQASNYRNAKNEIDQLPINSPEMKAYQNWWVKQASDPDPRIFIKEWHKTH